MIRILFERGEFDAYSTQITSLALGFSALGLIFFSLNRILVTTFYSLQDTKTPVWTAAVCLAVNAILNFALMGPLKIGGIALASSLAGALNFFLLFYFLEKKLGIGKENITLFLEKILAATALMGAAMWGLWNLLGGLAELARIIAVGCLGVVIYLAACFFLKIQEAQFFLKFFKLRR